MHKEKYLDILATGKFAKYSPAQLDSLHGEIAVFLGQKADSLDAAELFDLFELQFYLSLLTNRDVEAKSYLDRFNDQFAGQGPSQKIMVLRSMYFEATGDIKSAVAALGNNPDELRASRRLATFSRTKPDGSHNWSEYAKSLTYYLNLQPADVQAWAELGDVYSRLGHLDKAIFCWKELLLHRPTAYNAFYRVGHLHYVSHMRILRNGPDKKEALAEALDQLEAARDTFLRAVEISESCTEAWLGVYLLSRSELFGRVEKNKMLSARGNKVLGELEPLGDLARKMVKKHDRLEDAEFDALVTSS